ncbi:alpha,alpha-trehalase TreF [Solitalea lacus]|uniref:alpha,alpha-trehalase TreF n=1 Tax=Solitalea lacus TaxID=2911172 RepID=UPI001EDA16B3|nr:alpha,alpha-trehalase TreF [Solitalea lacus]UKJ06826.1 alpha,alpha-trehalase TreF [Solitalea lacus]
MVYLKLNVKTLLKKVTGLVIVFQLFLVQIQAQYIPDKDLKELFVDVQMARVFHDSKTFADCTPLLPPDSILKYYTVEKKRKDFNLSQFVKQYFQPPPPHPNGDQQLFSPLNQHLDSLWNVLERKSSLSNGTLIGLPYSYIVPGGRFNEIYYWDSYFTMLGLMASDKYQHVENMVNNFAYLIDEYGYIPNGNRTYYLSRSQPPYFSLMIELLARKKGDSIYVKYLPQLLAEYNFWMDGADRLTPSMRAYRRVVKLPNGSVLNRYWDESTTPRPESYREDVELAKDVVNKQVVYRNVRAACESGWDFSSRWFKDGISLRSIHTVEIIPVDLNCLLYSLELTIANAYQLKTEYQNQKIFEGKARKRKTAINKYCWSETTGFFFDYDFVQNKTKQIFSLAALYPLFFKVADEHQAERSVKHLIDYFLYPGGLVSTTVLSHQQWDVPNGWAPLQYITYQGLRAYGYKALADTIKNRWLKTVELNYQKTGKLLEKYNVLFPEVKGGGGEYPTQDGFGWTNGVYLWLKNEKE